VQYDYDMIVIGGGAGGLTAARTARGFGKKVALIEKNRLGGECTWTGCIPSKTFIKAARVAWDMKHLDAVGLAVGSNVTIDTSRVMDHVRSVVHDVYQTHTPDILAKEGIAVLFGEPRFVDPYHIDINGKILRAKTFIIATGSSPFVPPIDGIDTVNYMTNETFFNGNELPRSLLILGGGAIGAEMACACNRLGIHVTIIEMQERILVSEEPVLVSMLTARLQQEGVTVYTRMRAVRVTKQEDTIVVICEDEKGNGQKFSAKSLLVAAGRWANTQGLSLEKAGVKLKKESIIVNNRLQTTASHIYACGDVVGPYLFSHMAWHQAVIAVRNAIIPLFKKKIDYEHRIWVIFTLPELAHAGFTEKEAREKYGSAVTVFSSSYDAIDRAHTDGTTKGMAKFICDKKGRLVGAHIYGERAGEIIHEVQLAKQQGIRFSDMMSLIHAYPTYSELNWHAAKVAYRDRLEQNIFVKMLKKLFIKQ